MNNIVFNPDHYVHPTDKATLKALKAIPGFHQFVKAFMKVWQERQFQVTNLSSCVRMNNKQLSKYYDMLPPICEKLGISIPELYLKLDVDPNAYTYGDTNPFIVITSGLFETIPEELIPTTIAHECGHIACRHTLYTTMGNILLSGTASALRTFVPYGGLATTPLEMAFFYWMRCSELSADRAAVLCDGTAEKMSEVCLRLAGYDKDINAMASKEEFMIQAREYRNMIQDSKWNRTLEFLALSRMDHPLTTVRALECEEWTKTEEFENILNGTHQEKTQESIAELTKIDATGEDEPEAPTKPKFEFPKFKKKGKEEEPEVQSDVSVPNEIRKYKELLDEGVLTEEEFTAKKKQLLGI